MSSRLKEPKLNFINLYILLSPCPWHYMSYKDILVLSIHLASLWFQTTIFLDIVLWSTKPLHSTMFLMISETIKSQTPLTFSYWLIYYNINEIIMKTFSLFRGCSSEFHTIFGQHSSLLQTF